MRRYQDKAFKGIIKYAYTVPLYHDKYKKAGVHPNDIKGIDDVVKLPFVTKNDLRENFPDRILPIGYDRNNAHVICTGGTTGKSVSIYTDFITLGKGCIPFLNEMKFFNLDWKKSRFAHIGNFNSYRVDRVTQEKFQSRLKPFFSMGNQLNIDVDMKMVDIINKLDRFKPDVIMAYPAIFQHLAFLKRKGYGKNIKPKLFWTGGAMLDAYTKRYVQDAFGCRMLNIYPSVEAGANIAFECYEGTWHIHSDFFHLESIDENDKLVSPGERGHVALTRLWGKGTPIIRYTGMDDWVRILPNKECSCGLSTPIIKDGIEGRARANIVLPDGRVFPTGAFCFIEPILQKFGTYKIRQYQIIQKKIDEIDILLVIDEDLRDKGAPVDKIVNGIKKIYMGKVGPNVTINVKEVKEIKHHKDSEKPPPIVISNVSYEEGYNVLDH